MLYTLQVCRKMMAFETDYITLSHGLLFDFHCGLCKFVELGSPAWVVLSWVALLCVFVFLFVSILVFCTIVGCCLFQ